MKGIMRQSEPSRPIVSMIFTHQARMRCFFRKSITPIVGTVNNATVIGSMKDFDDDEEDDDDDDDDDDDAETVRDDDYYDANGREAIWERDSFSSANDYSELPLTEYTPNKNGNILVGGKGFKLPRFKNGSVLEYTITADEIKIRLLIDGEVDEYKAKYIYYVVPGKEFSDEGAMQGRYQVTPFKPLTIKNTTYNVPVQSKYVFYIVRHGQATHNLLKSKKEKIANVLAGPKDTCLTDEGKQQAQNSGEKMRNLLKMDTSVLPPQYLFSSDLKRTRETLRYFMNGLGIPYDNTKITVLPCAHELAFIASGDCDGHQLMTPPENTMSCSANDMSCLKNGNFNIDWDQYYRFYGNSTRSKLCKGCGARQCRDTDMVQEAIRIIREKSTSPSINFSSNTKISDGVKSPYGVWMKSTGGRKSKRHAIYKHHVTKKAKRRVKISRKKNAKKSHKRMKKTKKSTKKM